MVDHKFFLNAQQGTSSTFEPNDGFPDDILCRFCEQVDFLSPMRLLGELQSSYHVANVKAAFARMNILLLELLLHSRMFMRAHAALTFAT